MPLDLDLEVAVEVLAGRLCSVLMDRHRHRHVSRLGFSGSAPIANFRTSLSISDAGTSQGFFVSVISRLSDPGSLRYDPAKAPIGRRLLRGKVPASGVPSQVAEPRAALATIARSKKVRRLRSGSAG